MCHQYDLDRQITAKIACIWESGVWGINCEFITRTGRVFTLVSTSIISGVNEPRTENCLFGRFLCRFSPTETEICVRLRNKKSNDTRDDGTTDMLAIACFVFSG